MLKQTKKNFNQSANSTTRHASQHSRHSIVESFKSMVQNQISFRTNDDGASPKGNEPVQEKEKPKKRKAKKIDSEIFAEMVEMNKFLQIAIESKRDKTARF